MKRLILLALFYVIAEPVAAAEGLPLTLRRYDITCDQQSFDYITTNYWLDESIPCILVVEGDTLSNAAIRLRGESSRDYPKKSYKINLNRADRLEGRDKLNLISEWTDPTFAREFLSYDLFHRAGLPASRAWFAKVTINGRYAGLYLDVEELDEHFLDQAGLDSNGTLFKAADNGTLLKSGEIEAGLWQRETGTLDDFTALKELVGWLNRTSDADFSRGLSQRFEVQELIRAIAVNSLIGNTSTYYHNYFLLRATGEAGRWSYIPWDMDATFIYHGNSSEPQYNLSGHYLAGTNELIQRCWLNPSMRDRIIAEINGLADSLFQQSYYRPRCDSLIELLYDAVSTDTAKQYGLNDFVALLDNRPLEIEGRRARLKLDVSAPPYAFDVTPAAIAPGAVKFTWTSAHDDSTIAYSVYIDHTPLFNLNPQIFQSGNTTSLTVNLAGPDTLYWKVVAQTSGGRPWNSLTLAAKLILPDSAPQFDTLPESLTSSLTLTAEGGPYLIPRTCSIGENSTLAIQPGAMVYIADSCEIEVLGGLTIEGSVSDTFRLRPTTPGGVWKGIYVHGEGSKLSASWTEITASENEHSPVPVLNIWGGKAELDHCTIISTGSSGIFAKESDFQATNSVFSSDDGNSIWSMNSRRLVVDGCEFRGGGTDKIGIYNDASLVYISNNRFYGGGIYLWTSDFVSINACLFEEADCGVSFNRDNSNCQILNSIFKSCEIGLYGNGGSIANNDFALCERGISAQNGDLAVSNSVFWRCTKPIDASGSFKVDLRYCVVDPGSVPSGEGNIGLGPRFTDPWNGDFTPQDDSPLLDAGDGEIAPRLDYYGAARMDILAIVDRGKGRTTWADIGAIERQDGGVFKKPDLTLLTLESFPNPTNGRATVVFKVGVEGPAALSVTDVSGRRLFKKSYTNLTVGEHKEEWPEAGVAPTGLYFCRLEQASGVSVWKIAVVR